MGQKRRIFIKWNFRFPLIVITEQLGDCFILQLLHFFRVHKLKPQTFQHSYFHVNLNLKIMISPAVCTNYTKVVCVYKCIFKAFKIRIFLISIVLVNLVISSAFCDNPIKLAVLKCDIKFVVQILVIQFIHLIYLHDCVEP